MGRHKTPDGKRAQGGQVPVWPTDWSVAWAQTQAGGGWDRPTRVLVEQPDSSVAWATERVLTSRGWEVAVCPGPGRLAEGCPLLKDNGCPAVDGADAILFGLPLSSDQSRAVLAAHRDAVKARPVCVTTTTPEAERYRDILDEVILLREPILASTIVDALVEAMEI